MTSTELTVWAAIAIVVAALATFLIQKLSSLVARTLPQWNLNHAKERFAKIYPGKTIEQILAMFVQRDKTFSRLVVFLPYQCMGALLVLAALWAWVVPPSKPFWISVVQNLFIFEVTLMAMVPAFRILRGMQKMVIERLRELLK